MTVTVFGNLILISIDFYDFISPFSPQFYFRLRSDISNTEDHLTTFQKTEKTVENTMYSSGVFSLNFEVFLELW